MEQTIDDLFGKNGLFLHHCAGRMEFPMAMTSMFMGGGARVVCEDNIYFVERRHG
jgi:uncharacterized protein (DUF849 family)